VSDSAVVFDVTRLPKDSAEESMVGDTAWVPVTDPQDLPSAVFNGLEIRDTLPDVGRVSDPANSSLPFLEKDMEVKTEEPVEVIVSRVVYALLISASLVINLLLVIAIMRLKARVAVIYLLTAAMVIPDCIFYTKVIVELMNWDLAAPSWAEDDLSCGVWQFAAHLHPLLYSYLLVAIVYHAFVALFLDTRGHYERSTRRLLPLLIVGLTVGLSLVCAPSALYSRVLPVPAPQHEQQVCHLEVPPIGSPSSPGPAELEQAMVTYRLAYEIVLPYLLPLLLLAFPYVCLLIGLMRSLEATDHADKSTKMTVVVTLWILTSYLMLQVPSVLRGIFSIFSVWHRLTTLFDAEDDPRVPAFQTYIHMAAYIFTILWGIIRPSVCFKYSPKIRRALGP